MCFIEHRPQRRSSVSASLPSSESLVLPAVGLHPTQRHHPACLHSALRNGGVSPCTPLILLGFCPKLKHLPTAGDSVSSWVKRGCGRCQHLSPLLHNANERWGGRVLGKMWRWPSTDHHDYLHPARLCSSWLFLLPQQVAFFGPKQGQWTTYTWALN